MMDFTKLKKLTFGGVALKQLFINGIQVWKSGYKNWVPYAIDTDGSIYNGGLGYIDGYRLSSSGGLSVSDNTSTTGFIPVKAGDVIRIKGYRWYTTVSAVQYFIVYSSANAFAKVYTANSRSAYQTTTLVESMEYADGISTIKLKAGVSGYDYFRLCINDINEATGGVNSKATGANLIITVNEEIT